MILDPATVRFYQDKCSERISQLTDKLTKDISDEETRLTRARLKAFAELLSWKPDTPSTDNGVNFF